MRHIYLFLCFFPPVSANAAIPDTGRKTVVIDYPEVLQKAGVKNIHCIFKDSRKLLWIGTENGLYRYDGTNADLLEHDPGNPQTIPDDNIVSIAEDKSTAIAVGCVMAGPTGAALPKPGAATPVLVGASPAMPLPAVYVCGPV